MSTEKYFVCLADVKTVEITCGEKSCFLALSYYNNRSISWSSKPQSSDDREWYKKAYQAITDGIKNGERFVEINFSE